VRRGETRKEERSEGSARGKEGDEQNLTHLPNINKLVSQLLHDPLQRVLLRFHVVVIHRADLVREEVRAGLTSVVVVLHTYPHVVDSCHSTLCPYPPCPSPWPSLSLLHRVGAKLGAPLGDGEVEA
jgi:hypothetical protein